MPQGHTAGEQSGKSIEAKILKSYTFNYLIFASLNKIAILLLGCFDIWTIHLSYCIENVQTFQSCSQMQMSPDETNEQTYIEECNPTEYTKRWKIVIWTHQPYEPRDLMQSPGN